MAASSKRKVVAEGHLIDTGLFSKYLDIILEGGATYEVAKFDVGRTRHDISRLEMMLSAPDPVTLEHILENLLANGCMLVEKEDEVVLAAAPQDGVAPEGFHSTTNHRTRIFHQAQWLDVAQQRMDAVIIVVGTTARCLKLRDLRQGNLVVMGLRGVQVFPPFRDRERSDFVFMDNEVSSERRVELAVALLAQHVKALKAKGGRTVVVCGPVAVHTGGSAHLCRIIRGGYVQALLSGNALGVHDVEAQLLGTSLGVDVKLGRPVTEGHSNHMRAINVIRRCGSLGAAVEQGVLKSGVMYESIKAGVELVLAGSIRDDGPLPDTLMDMVEAQAAYSKALEGADLVLILSTMLHGIGVGNMTPSWVRTVCVDINPAVVTKLVDRGSAQASGIVTDVGLFLRLLADELER